MGRLSVLENQGYINGKKVPLWHEKKGLYEGGQKTLDPIPVNANVRVFFLLLSGRNPLSDFSWY